MDTNISKLKSYQPSSATVSRPCLQKRNKVHVRRLNRRSRLSKEAIKKAKVGKLEIMEMKNLKLYLKNKSIFEDNQRLQKQALFLQHENEELLSQIQKIHSSHNSSKTN